MFKDGGLNCFVLLNMKYDCIILMKKKGIDIMVTKYHGISSLL